MAATADRYVAGACNIGAWEIRRRRRAAMVGFGLAGLLLVVLLIAGAPPVARLAVGLPLWGGMLSWLQARRRFCAGFAVAGIANFRSDRSVMQAVVDPRARRADLLTVARMTRDSFLLALPITLVAVLLPL